MDEIIWPCLWCTWCANYFIDQVLKLDHENGGITINAIILNVQIYKKSN